MITAGSSHYWSGVGWLPFAGEDNPYEKPLDYCMTSVSDLIDRNDYSDMGFDEEME